MTQTVPLTNVNCEMFHLDLNVDQIFFLLMKQLIWLSNTQGEKRLYLESIV